MASMQTETRPEIIAFAQLLEATLKANDHKPGWKDMEPSDILGCLFLVDVLGQRPKLPEGETPR